MKKKWLVTIVVFSLSVVLAVGGQMMIEELKKKETEQIKHVKIGEVCTALSPECGYYEKVPEWKITVLRFLFLFPLIGWLGYVLLKRKEMMT